MGVSRQAVCKWEGALSIPDINKIIQLSQIFGVTGMVKERRENYSDTYMKFVILGITLCVLAEIPLFCIAMIEVNDFYAVVALSVMLAIVAIGVFLL